MIPAHKCYGSLQGWLQGKESHLHLSLLPLGILQIPAMFYSINTLWTLHDAFLLKF